MGKSQLTKSNMFAARGQDKNEEETQRLYRKVRDSVKKYIAIMNKLSAFDVGFDGALEKYGGVTADLFLVSCVSFMSDSVVKFFVSSAISNPSLKSLITRTLPGLLTAKASPLVRRVLLALWYCRIGWCRNMGREKPAGEKSSHPSSSPPKKDLPVEVKINTSNASQDSNDQSIPFQRPSDFEEERNLNADFQQSRELEVDLCEWLKKDLPNKLGTRRSNVGKETKGQDVLSQVSRLRQKEGFLNAGLEQLKELKGDLDELFKEDLSPEVKARISDIRKEISGREALHWEALSSVNRVRDTFSTIFLFSLNDFRNKNPQFKSTDVKKNVFPDEVQHFSLKGQGSGPNHADEKDELMAEFYSLTAENQDLKSQIIANKKKSEEESKKFKKENDKLNKSIKNLKERNSFLQEELNLLGDQVLEGSGNFHPSFKRESRL